MAKVEIEFTADVPAGFALTGEFRKPNLCEWYLNRYGGASYACDGENAIGPKWLLVELPEPFFDLGYGKWYAATGEYDIPYGRTIYINDGQRAVMGVCSLDKHIILCEIPAPVAEKTAGPIPREECLYAIICPHCHSKISILQIDAKGGELMSYQTDAELVEAISENLGSVPYVPNGCEEEEDDEPMRYDAIITRYENGKVRTITIEDVISEGSDGVYHIFMTETMCGSCVLTMIPMCDILQVELRPMEG
jgi:hypothetical protein